MGLEQEAAERLERLANAVLSHRSSGATLPFLLGCLVGSTALILLIGTAAAVYYSLHSQRTKQRQLLAAVDLAGATPSRLRRLLGDVLPAWANQPDMARVEWMNTLNKQLWPHIDAAACKLLLKDAFLEDLLNGSTFWRPSLLMGAHIGVQAVMLGREPPTITGVKTFRNHEYRVDEALMEFSFAWASKMEVKLLVTMLGEQRERGNMLRSMLSSASRVRVGVSDLVVRGTLRIAIKPLLDELPVAGGIKVSFMGTPDFTYKVSALGGNPYLLPGVEQLVASFVRENVLKPFTFPDGFGYDMVTGTMGQSFEKPAGMLEVTVLGATNVPRMDWYGKADPYCQLWLRDNRKLRTAVARRTLNPTWGERFQFVCHSVQTQEITFCIFDSDRLSSDDLAGMTTLPISSLDLTPGAMNDLWLPMDKPSRKGKAAAIGKGDEGEISGQRERVVHIPGDGGKPVGGRQEDQMEDNSAATSGRSSGGGRRSAAAAMPVAEAEEQADDEDGEEVEEGAAAAMRLAAEEQEAAEQEQQQHEAAERRAAAAAAAAERHAAGGAAAKPPRTASARSFLSPAMSTMPSSLEQFVRLAASPLEALRSKRCLLHIQATYLPLTEAEVEAMAREHSRQRHGGRALTRTSTKERSQNILSLMNSGVLYVYLDHAQGLGGSTVKGFTRNFEARVRVGDIEKRTEHGQVPFRHRSNPVFDETLEVIVDGATAQQRDLQVVVEIWMLHMLRKPTFRGRVRLPLQEIVERKRWRDSWPLADVAQGTLTMELSWMGALAI